MPVLSERKGVVDKPPIYVQQVPSNQVKSGSPKKKRKGKKSKFRKQYLSSSLINLSNENSFKAEESESNCQIRHIYRPMTQLNTDRSPILTRLPQLLGRLRSRTPTPTPSLSCASSSSCTPRSSIGCRLPVTLPINKQPESHERRKKLPILAAIKPENERAEKDRFLRANYNYNPLFVYRFPADAEVLERLGKPSDKYMKHVSFFQYLDIFCTVPLDTYLYFVSNINSWANFFLLWQKPEKPNFGYLNQRCRKPCVNYLNNFVISNLQNHSFWTSHLIKKCRSFGFFM